MPFGCPRAISTYQALQLSGWCLLRRSAHSPVAGSTVRKLIHHYLPFSAEPQFRADPVGEATDRGIRFGCGAGEELKDVLHLRHELERHIHAGLAREIGQL